MVEHDQQILITFIIVCRNEEEYISNAVDFIKSEMDSIGKKRCELIIIDGISDDKTMSILNTKVKKLNDYDIKLINNLKKTLATGWNKGIKLAKGEYVIRPDAHGALEEGYVEKGLNILESHPEVVAVGGVLKTVGTGHWGNLIMEALSSPIAVGNSVFRTGLTSGYTDTAVFAIYRKNVFSEVGLFNESLVRHQDNDMHSRIRNAGWKFWTDSNMSAIYYCRNKPQKLFEQMYKIGYYLPDLIKVGSHNGIRLRNFAPFIFYTYTTFCLILIFFTLWSLVLLIPFVAYLLIILIYTLKLIYKKRSFFYINSIWLIPLMHIFYGIGTFVGIVKLFITKKR